MSYFESLIIGQNEHVIKRKVCCLWLESCSQEWIDCILSGSFLNLIIKKYRKQDLAYENLICEKQLFRNLGVL